MTFIASIVARDGVAIIADSLVTTQLPVIDYQKLFAYLEDVGTKELGISAEGLMALFELRAVITFAGSARINNQRIAEIVEAAKANLHPKPNQNISEKVKEFSRYIEGQVKEHINEKGWISTTVFLITHYSIDLKQTSIFRLTIHPLTSGDLLRDDFIACTTYRFDDFLKVVCAGQSRITERILYGEMLILPSLISKAVEKTLARFNIHPNPSEIEAINKELMMDREIITNEIIGDYKLDRLTELSLQQAVDLAHLRLKLEVHLQRYTEDIPTVGGLTKLAVIDKEGFRFISGGKVVRPGKT
jgi:hypothetical protein